MPHTNAGRSPVAHAGLSRVFYAAVRSALAPLPAAWLVGLSLCLVVLMTGLLHSLQAALSLYDGLRTLRPYGIGYLAPVMLMTAIGGRRAGFLTLALSCLATLYLSPLIHSARSELEVGLLALTGFFVVNGLGAMRQNATLLADLGGTAAGEEIMRQIREVVESTPGGLRLQTCLVRRRGLDLYVDVDVAVGDAIPYGAVRDLTDAAEQALCRSNPLIFQARVRAH